MEKNDRVAIIIACIFAVFLYCTLITPPRLPEPDIYAHPLPEGCLVYALSFRSSLNARALLDDRSYWSDVAGIKFKGSSLYHAVLIFEYNNGTWIYDCNQGSYQVSNKRLSNLKEILDQAYFEAEIEDCMWLRSDYIHNDKKTEED